MGQVCFITGRSGAGKSFSLKNFPKEKLALINVQGKILPFRGGDEIRQEVEDGSEKICGLIETFSHGGYKSIVVDDYQYVMANEFMRRAYESGWDKFMEIGRHAWDIIDCVRQLPQDVIVYVLCHIESTDNGNEKIKTIGRMLDEKICLEGMATIVLKADCADGKYFFTTQNSGKDTVKSPEGLFPSFAIENDLYYVDNKIRNYYHLGEYKEDGEIEEKAMDIEPGKRKRGRNEVKKENAEKVVNAGLDKSDKREEVPFDEVKNPEIEKLPRATREEAKADVHIQLPERKKRNYEEKPREDVGDGFVDAPEGMPVEKPKRRRRDA